jgi:hypothetical protein
VADLSHLAWPYRLGADVEQLSHEELVASAAVIACTPRGHRDDLPSFGRRPASSSSRALDLERLAAELVYSPTTGCNVDAEEIPRSRRRDRPHGPLAITEVA